MTHAWVLHTERALDEQTHQAVVDLDATAARADGVTALDDQVRLDLQHAAEAEHIVARAGPSVLGYAHADLRRADTVTGHIVVHPEQRRRGIGRSLATRLADLSGDRQLAVWAHGDLPSAAALADRLGWHRGRELRQLILSRSTEIAEAAYPEGVTVRTFVPGQDEAAWVEVNAAAFASHPEQGRMTVTDLEQREEQDWFDPQGFFLAERDGELLGSHWTKVHHTNDGHAIGEVHVIGVSPRAQGLGLGRALTLTGLKHLREQGLDVMLYVEADNTAGVALYEGIGFTTAHVDVQYQRHN